MKVGTVRRRGRGLSLLEVGFALAIAAIAVTWLAQDQHRRAEEAKADAAAQRIAVVRAAAQEYVEARYEDILVLTLAGGAPVAIPAGRTSPGGGQPEGTHGLPSLQAAGHLPDAFVDRNAFGHAHAVLVRQTERGLLEGMVAATGGRAVPDAGLGRIARSVGPFGGFVPTAPLPGVRAGTITGTFGGWSAEREQWRAEGAAPEPGRPVAMLDSAAEGIMARLAYQVRRGIEGRARAPMSGETAALLREAEEMLRRQARENEDTHCRVFALCDP